MERAMELLSNMKIKLETVAKQCGFSSASNFCRAFKARKGASPTRWRRETLIRYRIPKAGRASEVGEHGRPDRRMQ